MDAEMPEMKELNAMTLERIAELRDNPPPDCGWRICADSFREYLQLLDLAERALAAPPTGKLLYYCICGHRQHEHEPDCVFCKCEKYQPLIHPPEIAAPRKMTRGQVEDAWMQCPSTETVKGVLNFLGLLGIEVEKAEGQ